MRALKADGAKLAPTAEMAADDEAIHARWVAQMQGGDSAAFESLFRYYAPHLLAYARARLGHVAEVDDAVHDVFVAMWRNRETLHITYSVRAYLFSAVHHRILNVRRARRRDPWEVGRVKSEFVPLTATSGATDDYASAHDLALAAAKALATLPERNREVYRLVREHGLTQSEVAHTLGISVKAVEGHIARATIVLRAQLSDWHS